jgi:hypothetical protein
MSSIIQKTTQTTSSVMMIRPIMFGYNPETAESNVFQSKAPDNMQKKIQERALAEFDIFVERLRENGINVIVFQDHPEPHTPDSIFPNNWVSFHQDGRVVLYPMMAHNRRLEKKIDFITSLEFEHDFRVKEIIDLSYFENENKFLEGTGSMVLDRVNKIVYSCRSPRTHPEALNVFCKLFKYSPFLFTAMDYSNTQVYHTNVVMAVGDNIAVVCSEAIKDAKEKNELLDMLKTTGKTTIEISKVQMNSFSGNMLQLKNNKDELVLVMSEQGFSALKKEQLDQILDVTNILHSDISHIEKYGGGSARCMMAEIFNPKV